LPRGGSSPETDSGRPPRWPRLRGRKICAGNDDRNFPYLSFFHPPSTDAEVFPKFLPLQKILGTSNFRHFSALYFRHFRHFRHLFSRFTLLNSAPKCKLTRKISNRLLPSIHTHRSSCSPLKFLFQNGDKYHK